MLHFQFVMEGLIVHNVKARFKIRKKKSEHVKEDLSIDDIVCIGKYTSHSNFDVEEFLTQKYLVFNESPTINVTGIKNFDKVIPIIEDYCKIRRLALDLCSITVDNSTATTSIPNVSRTILGRIAKEHRDQGKDYTISALLRHFPSILIRDRTRGKPTVSIFPSGKILILGGKSLKAIEEALLRALGILREHGWSERETEAKRNDIMQDE